MNGLRIGLTGGIGSGKSTAARQFVDRGACLVDTDAIAHSLTAAQGAAMPALVAEFGTAVVASDGALARDVMRQLVFDVPLLAESRHWRQRVDKVLVVDCSEAMQIARVARRPGWDATMAQRVLDQQATRAARRAVADAVIFNDAMTLTALAQAVEALGLWWGLWNNPRKG